VLLVCVDLPRIIYPPNKSFIFHRRVADLLFGDQPVLQTLALENALITVSTGTGLNHIQRNVVREWLSRPVGPDHRVYQAAAEYLTEAEAATYCSEPHVGLQRRRAVIPPGLAIGWDRLRRGFESAVEASRRPKRPRKKKKRHPYRTPPTGGDTEERRPLIKSWGSSEYETQELLIFSDVSSDVMFTPDHMMSTTCFVQVDAL